MTYLEALETETAKLDATGNSFVFTTSLENSTKGSTAGTVAEVSNAIAARMFVEGVARVSTQEEIDAHLRRGPSVGANPAEVTV